MNRGNPRVIRNTVMSGKFHNKYRTISTRLQNWDYAWNAYYFITICTKEREHYFGEIRNNKMYLSNIGTLARVFWYEIKTHTKYVALDAFVVMPDHIHGILVINNPANGNNRVVVVDTRHALYLPQPQQANIEQTIGQRRFQNQGKNTLSSIIGPYKSAVTKHANRLGCEFAWQSGFYDHIIRNDSSYKRIKNYIEANVQNWDKEKYND